VFSPFPCPSLGEGETVIKRFDPLVFFAYMQKNHGFLYLPNAFSRNVWYNFFPTGRNEPVKYPVFNFSFIRSKAGILEFQVITDSDPLPE
jgi:hypothetical protein